MVKDEKIYYNKDLLKNLIFMGGFTGNQYVGGNCLKSGAWTSTRFKGRGMGFTKKSRREEFYF